MRLRRSALMTNNVPREKAQLTCRSTPTVQPSSTMFTPAAAAAAVVVSAGTRSVSFVKVTSRANAIAKTYKPGGVVILGSHSPVLFVL